MEERQDSIVINDTVFLKHKLKNILCCKQFCGICLENEENFNETDEKLEILVNNWRQNISLMDIIDNIFNESENILASGYICNKCTDRLVQAYIFITDTKLTTKLINNFIADLDSKAGDIKIHLGESVKLDSSNIVIVLENDEIDKYMSKEKDTNEIFKEKNNLLKGHISTKRILKRKICTMYKCVECRINLPTHLAWRRHEIEFHKKKTMQCKICFKSFRTQQYLSAHRKVHSQVECKICDSVVPDEEMIEHMRNNHQESMHSCEICNISYYSASDLKSHQKMCYPTGNHESQCVMCYKHLKKDDLQYHKCKFNCTECTEMPCIHYKYLIYYREQILSQASKAKCLDCNYTCRKKDILLGHVNKEHLNHHPYSCDKCGQQFYCKTILKAHIHRFHQETFLCEFCDIDFNSETGFESHKKCCESIKRECVCDECPASFDTLLELSEHEKRRHNEVFPCGLCNKRFLKESKRKEHMVKVHSGLQTKNRRMAIACAVCEDRFISKRQLVQHMRKHGPSAKYPCRICNTEYETLRKLRAHSQKHIGPFATCHVCGKEIRQVLLEKHLKSHISDGVVTCETCGKSFQSVALLKYHQKTHLDNVPCPKCDKLINPARLRRHWKGHLIENNPSLKAHRKKRPYIKCELCDYIAWNHVLLECHMNRHHLKLKPYICHICSKDFIGKHLLQKHLKVHTVDNVVCMICGKSFANSECLKMHLKLHTGEKNYACDICGEKFRSSSIMNVHKQKKHSDKNNACPLCTSKFHTIRDMRRHVIKVHWKQKEKRFDPRELDGLEDHYHLFHDGRRVAFSEDDVEFYTPS